MSNLAYIGIGSNLGDRIANCREAVRNLQEAPEIEVRRTSGVYETEPVGPWPEQPAFLNGVVEVETLLDAEALLELLLDIEDALGRTREIAGGPRTIDLDLLIYGDLVFRSAHLEVPHPRLAERRFVLVPLLELGPTLLHPRTLQPLRELLDRAPTSQVHLHPELSLQV